MNKHVSWVLALVVGLAIGYVSRGAWDGGGRQPARPPQAAGARPARQVEDPKAVYRVPVDGSPAKGPADALVTIVESSDFECPFCKRVVPTLKQIEESYRGKVRFVFKQNPLPFHARALPAAIAAEEARAQGGDEKFWAMHDALFAAPSLDDAAIAKAAADAGVDAGKVKDAIAAGKHKERIERDQRLVQSLGAPGTPSFFVNGRKLTGAQPYEAFRALVDEELRKAEALVRAGTPAAQVYAKIAEGGATAPVHLPGGAPQERAAQPPPGPPAAAPAAVYREVTVRSDDPARGPAAAKLTVVLFSDFQCPFCGRVEPSLKQLEEAFPGQVRIVWKHQPLPMHPQAVPAAIAAEAAREQGKFWPMHDAIFTDQKALDDATLARHARAVGLDMRRYEQAVAAKRGQDRISEDQKLAQAVGANGTPTMFFNCRQVVGARPFEQLRAAAEEELKKADALLGGKRPDAGFHERACKANVAAAPPRRRPPPRRRSPPAPSRSGRTTRSAGTRRRRSRSCSSRTSSARSAPASARPSRRRCARTATRCGSSGSTSRSPSTRTRSPPPRRPRRPASRGSSGRCTTGSSRPSASSPRRPTSASRASSGSTCAASRRRRAPGSSAPASRTTSSSPPASARRRRPRCS
jgi:protein-disulfide isomerase